MREASYLFSFPIVALFAFDHLPPHLQDVARPFHTQAHELARIAHGDLPSDLRACGLAAHQTQQALESLLDAKDRAVRAKLMRDKGTDATHAPGIHDLQEGVAQLAQNVRERLVQVEEDAAASVKTLSERVDVLRRDLDGHGTAGGELGTKVEQLRADVDKVREDLARCATGIAELATGMAELTRHVRELNADVARSSTRPGPDTPAREAEPGFEDEDTPEPGTPAVTNDAAAAKGSEG